MPAARHLVTERSPRPDAPPYRAFVPRDAEPHTPLVLVHGRSRSPGRMFRAFLPAAMAHGIPLIAPHFSRDGFPGYQSLAGVAGPLAAQDALVAALRDAQDTLGLATDSVDLMGFSGGAQFAHRFALRTPTSVRRLVVAAAGWYTYLDPRHEFPRGTGATAELAAVDPRGLLGLPLLLLVGEHDTERDADLRTSGWLDRRQGPHRVERALRWMDHLETVARRHGLQSQAHFDLLPATGHSFRQAVQHGGLVRRTLDFLHGSDTLWVTSPEPVEGDA